MFRVRDYFIAGFILVAASALIWGVTIKPHDYVWIDDGETTGQVHTILPSQTIIGPSSLKALVEMPDGTKTILEMPMDAEIRKDVYVKVYQYRDAENSAKKKYEYAGLAD